MAHDFTGYNAIVTGAAGGIGFATAEVMARGGASVGLIDIDEARLGDAAAKLAKVGAVGGTAAVDVRDYEAVTAAVDNLVGKLGGLDVLVNNAGVECVGTLEGLEIDEIQRAVDINLLGVFYVTRAALPYLRKSEHASIVNLASQAAKRATPMVGIYSATKAAVLGWGRAAAVELAPTVRVNAVCPGIVDTPMIERHYDNVERLEGLARTDAQRQFESNIPMGRTQKPSDVANAIAFLASRDASEITGQALNVCGGMVMD